jgi:glyoxylase-like metal-dependent hydrolase (beta-lactamase superfamily II)
MTAFVEMQEFNPFLSKEAVDELLSAAQDWQELCRMKDKLRRCLKCCPGHGLGEADDRVDTTPERLLEELLNKQQWSRKKFPGWLAFEVRPSTIFF